MMLLHMNNAFFHAQGAGKLIFSMDALFGLCRKKAAGASVCPPLNEGLLFEDVRDFVECYSMNTCETATEKVH